MVFGFKGEMMYAIKNKRTGEYAARRHFWFFEPCNGNLPPILYTRERDAVLKCRNLQTRMWYSEKLGFAAATDDELEVVRVELKEVTP